MKHLLTACLCFEGAHLGLENLPTFTLLAAALALGHEGLVYCLGRGGLN